MFNFSHGMVKNIARKLASEADCDCSVCVVDSDTGKVTPFYGPGRKVCVKFFDWVRKTGPNYVRYGLHYVGECRGMRVYECRANVLRRVEALFDDEAIPECSEFRASVKECLGYRNSCACALSCAARA